MSWFASGSHELRKVLTEDSLSGGRACKEFLGKVVGKIVPEGMESSRHSVILIGTNVD